MEEQEKFVENLDFASPETFTQSVEISESETVQEDEVEPPKPKSSRRRKKPVATEEVQLPSPEPPVNKEVKIENSPSEPSITVDQPSSTVQEEKPVVRFGINRFRNKR